MVPPLDSVPFLAVELWSIAATGWLLLLAGPLLFFLAIVAASVVFSTRGVPPDAIGDHVSTVVSHLLLVVLLTLGTLAVLLAPAEVASVWSVNVDGTTLVDATVGGVVGALLAVAYLSVLAPLLERAQASIGDYVPPGSVRTSLAGSVPAFFVANVIVAPVVEETVYRGYAIPLLGDAFGVPVAVALSCLFFGLLHWPGGLWYVLLTGVVAGGLFAGLFLWSGGIVAPFVAHFVLNVIEFGDAWRSGADRVPSPDA